MMKRSLFVLLLLLFLINNSPALAADNGIQITDIKMAKGVDEKYMPVGPAKSFPNGTAKVFCWFEWKNAEVKNVLTVKWTYVTESIPILDQSIPMPRKSGSGGVALAMPGEKTFPDGEYEVQLLQDKKVLKTLRFEILKKKSSDHGDSLLWDPEAWVSRVLIV